MEALHKFDEELKKLNDYNILITKITVYMLAFFGCMIWIFPDTDSTMSFFTGTLLMLSISLYLKSFLFVTINKKPVSVFQILKSTPISKTIYLKDRYIKLRSFLFKLGRWCIGIKILGLLLFRETDIKTIIMSFLLLSFMFLGFTLCGIINIKMSTI